MLDLRLYQPYKQKLFTKEDGEFSRKGQRFKPVSPVVESHTTGTFNKDSCLSKEKLNTNSNSPNTEPVVHSSPQASGSTSELTGSKTVPIFGNFVRNQNGEPSRRRKKKKDHQIRRISTEASLLCSTSSFSSFVATFDEYKGIGVDDNATVWKKQRMATRLNNAFNETIREYQVFVFIPEANQHSCHSNREVEYNILYMKIQFWKNSTLGDFQ
ncbi:MLL3 [Mytilus coruscus]|uniref:MLL3 n=1 Tax=Mytilus coruscus TaxID=42192 RepID=A0A6J8E5T0_MYTCO|nr:MLL3 [Mytilus coruscus]